MGRFYISRTRGYFVKKIILALMAVFMLSGSALAIPTVRLRHLRGQDSSNATFTVLAGSSTQSIWVYGFWVNVATADNVTIKCGANTKAIFSFGDHAGYDAPQNYFAQMTCDPTEDLTITKGTAATVLNYKFFVTQE